VHIVFDGMVNNTWMPSSPWVILRVLCPIVVMTSAAFHSLPKKKNWGFYK